MQITFNFSELRFISAADNQKAFSRLLDTEESLRTLQGLAHKFKDLPRTPLKFKDFSRLCEPCYWRVDNYTI